MAPMHNEMNLLGNVMLMNVILGYLRECARV